MEGKVEKFNGRKEIEFKDLKYTIYFETALITSGIATIPAGGKGDLDKGHEGAEEVFTVASGAIVVLFPDSDSKYELGTGDALLIPPGESHIVENHSSSDATFIFTGAPKL